MLLRILGFFALVPLQAMVVEPQAFSQSNIPTFGESLAPSWKSQESAASTQRVTAELSDQKIESLPAPNIVPAAIEPVSVRTRKARLQRGNKVFEISNEAFRSSGILERAIRETPELAASYQEYEARALQKRQLNYQLGPQASATKDAADSQQLAAEKFESELWTTGFKGAKVASVSSSTATLAGSLRPGYVLLDSIGFGGSDNLGYSYTTIQSTGDFGATYVPSEYLLPLPQDPNDPFYLQADSAYTQRAPDGWMLMLTDDKTTNPIFQALMLPRLGLNYDTGVLGTNGGSFPERVNLASRRANAAGQTDFFQGGDGDVQLPVDAALNAQILDIGGGTTGQMFLTGNNDFDLNRLQVETFGVRAYVRRTGALFEGWSLVAGKKQSVFGAIELKPQGLEADRALVGTVDTTNRNRIQLAVSAPLTEMLSWNVGFEDPTNSDLLFSGMQDADRTVLKRWPTVATNLTLTAPDSDEKFLLGALFRPIAYQVNATGREEYANAWGLSAIAKLNLLNGTNFFGIAGGNGIGDYIRGINHSIVGSPTSVETLYGYGAFAGRQVVFKDECNVPTSEINISYGYGMMENPTTFTEATNRKYHQLGANYFKYFGDRAGMGAEYQYGFRQVSTDDVGENHRVTFMLAVRTGKVQSKTTVQEYVMTDSVALADQSTGSPFEEDFLASPTTSQAAAPAPTTLGGKGFDL